MAISKDSGSALHYFPAVSLSFTRLINIVTFKNCFFKYAKHFCRPGSSLVFNLRNLVLKSGFDWNVSFRYAHVNVFKASLVVAADRNSDFISVARSSPTLISMWGHGFSPSLLNLVISATVDNSARGEFWLIMYRTSSRCNNYITQRRQTVDYLKLCNFGMHCSTDVVETPVTFNHSFISTK